MQNISQSSHFVELSIILPLLGEGVCLEGMLKLLTIDIEAPYEIIVICQRNELASDLVERIGTKYNNIVWIEKYADESTLHALSQGVQAAVGQYVLIVCAQTAGPEIPVNQMLNLSKEGCDFVSSTRYAGRGLRLGGSWFETTLSKIANYLLYSLSGCAFSDSTTGLKLFRKEIFPRLILESKSKGWVVAFEMALKAQNAGLKVGEVETIAIDRLYGGKSTFELKEFFDYVRWFFWALFKLRKTSITCQTVPHTQRTNR